MGKVIKVTLSIPNEGHTQVQAYANRLVNCMHLGKLETEGLLKDQDPRFEFSLLTVGGILTPLAREEAAKVALENNSDYLYFIDDDMICPDNLFERLWRWNVDIVAPLAFTRNYPHKAVIYECKEGYDPVTRCEYFINHYVTEYPKDTLVECDAVGFGAALIKRSVLEGVPEPRFMSTNATGEDILFCHMARKKGFRVFMDTSTKLGHLGHPAEITEEYVEKVRKEFKFHENQPLCSKYDNTYTNENLILGR